MYKYIFSGIIHPKRVNFSIDRSLPFLLQHQDFGIAGKTLLEFKNSRFTVVLNSNIDYSKNDTCNLETLKNFIEENVRLVVDIYCYIKSYCYDVEVSKVKCNELGIDYIFGVQGEWNINKNEKETNEELTKIMRLFTSQERMFLKDVLADFRRSIENPAMTASFCYRAIETIRQFYFEDHSIKDKDKRRDQGWEKLRDEFQLSRDDFNEIEKFATPNRHGSYPKIVYSERERIMNFTRSIIDKMIQKLHSEPQSTNPSQI